MEQLYNILCREISNISLKSTNRRFSSENYKYQYQYYKKIENLSIIEIHQQSQQ